MAIARDPINGLVTSDGAAYAASAPGSAIAISALGESGTIKQGWMFANTTTPVGQDGAVVKDSTGYKAFRITLKGVMGAEGTDVIAIGWSTTYDDASAIASKISTFSIELGTQPEPAVLRDDISAILRNNGSVVVRWDGTNKIKTIAVRVIAGQAKKLFIEVVE